MIYSLLPSLLSITGPPCLCCPLIQNTGFNIAHLPVKVKQGQQLGCGCPGPLSALTEAYIPSVTGSLLSVTQQAIPLQEQKLRLAPGCDSPDLLGCLPLETNLQPEICRCCSKEKAFFFFVSSLPCSKNSTKPHAAKDQLWHEADTVLTFHSSLPVVWSGSKAARKVLSQHLAKGEGKGA